MYNIIMEKNNTLMYLLKKYPDANWDICELLRNPNIDIKYIRDFYTKRYSYKNWKTYIKHTSYNINIDIEFIKKNIYHLDWSGISRNNKFNTDVNFIKTYARFLNWSVISSYNIPLNVIQKTNDLPWNWGKSGISSNLNLKVFFIKKFINKPFDWNIISTNSCITIGFLKIKQIRTKINWRLLSYNNGLTIEMLKQFPNEDWDWEFISSHISVSKNNENISLTKNLVFNFNSKDYRQPKSILLIEFFNIFSNKNWKWNWRSISKNELLTVEMLEKFHDKDWDWSNISCNFKLTIEMLEKFPEKDWCWKSISSNEALTIEMLEKFPDKNWNWTYISFNRELTIEMLEKFPDKNWDWELISSNIQFTIEMFEKFPDKNWNFGAYGISHNRSLTIEILEKFPDKDWDFSIYGGISSHFRTSGGYISDFRKDYLRIIKMIEKFPDKKWSWSTISENEYLKIKFIEKHINKINFNTLSYNDFNYFNKLEKTPKIKLFYYLSSSTLSYDVRRYITTF